MVENKFPEPGTALLGCGVVIGRTLCTARRISFGGQDIAGQLAGGVHSQTDLRFVQHYLESQEVVVKEQVESGSALVRGALPVFVKLRVYRHINVSQRHSGTSNRLEFPHDRPETQLSFNLTRLIAEALLLLWPSSLECKYLVF